MAATKDQVLLTSAVRTATATTADVDVPDGANTAIFTLDVNSSADQITLTVDAYDRASGKYTAFAAFTITPASTAATYQKILSPWTAYAAGGTTAEHKIGPLPSQFRVRTVQTGSAGITFTLGVQFN